MTDLDLDELVDGVARIAAESFADLGFLESCGELDLRSSVPGATAIRFELPRIEYLHLASVIIDADGLDDPVRQTTRTMSSVWKDYDRVLESGVIFDAANREKGFHTKKESYPWLEIGFDRPRELSGVKVRNVEGVNSVRARGLQVQVRTADGRLITAYDGIERERQFVRAAEHFANGSAAPVTDGQPVDGLQARVLHAGKSFLTKAAKSASRANRSAAQAPELVEAPDSQPKKGSRPPIRPAQPDVVKILTRLELRDYAPGRNALDHLKLTAEQVSHFRALVNRRYLFGQELEWTSHGVRRSFRFWTEQQRQDYLRFALEVISALQDLTRDVCFGFGSVLAIVRDQNLIPHDDDLDVLIGFEPEQAGTLFEGRQLVRACLQAKGFQVTGGMSAYQWVQRAGGGLRLDVFIGVFEADKISWYPGKRGGLTRAQLFPAIERDFLGRPCPVPHRPEEYLEQIYGPGWRDPDPNFQHSWNPAAYADISGT
ncbi:hypothetical protein FOE78_12110 [Microlunatus elymi]|uniref:LicD family protein n=1 Tax=Microlunatus elymi TaxID=2596828 RepID=A0A516PZF7_9ACTN|nr:hypothetical protein [Microlunatus elymi]QDP96550.1 hypothetical protein FOE78_12110 [Microlunatus elymi]